MCPRDKKDLNAKRLKDDLVFAKDS